MPGYTFDFPSIAVAISGANVAGINFVGTAIPPATYSISGTVTEDGVINPLVGATMTLSGAADASTTTDAGGNYTFPNLANGTYTVTPSLAGYTFNPVSTEVVINDAVVIWTNFIGTSGTPTTFSISGTVTSGGSVLPGVTMTLNGAGSSGTTTTDASGDYIFPGLADGSYEVTPSLAGYTFDPVNRAVIIAGADVTGQDFTGTAAPVVDPTPNIMANGSDGPVSLGPSDPLSITVNFDPGTYTGTNADWWIAVDTPDGWWYYVYPFGWYPAADLSMILPSWQGALGPVGTFEILNTILTTPGPHIFYFGVDTIMNGVIDFDHLFYDAVLVNVIAIAPTPDIMANGSDGPVALSTSDPLSITVNFDPGSYAGMNADWWIAVEGPDGWWYYSYPTGWYPIADFSLLLPTYQGPLVPVGTFEILNTTLTTPGPYIFYFGVDTIMNGVIDFDIYYDAVVVNVI
jgi:hypothetical protein